MSGTAGPAREPAGRIVPVGAIVASAVSAIILGQLLQTGPIHCPNDQSRWCTVWSLVEHGTYVIDGAPWEGTIDKVRRDGHFYSSKPPLLPTMLAGEYWLIKRITGWTIADDTAYVVRVILVTVNIIPLFVFILLYARWLDRRVEDPWWRLYWLIAGAAGTYLTAFCVTLNNHTVGGFSAFFSMYCALQIVLEGSRRPVHFALAGFFAAFTATDELPAGLFALVLFVYLLRVAPRHTLAFGLPGALLPVAGHFATTYIATGGLRPYYTFRNTDLYKFDGSYWSNPTGIDALSENKLLYLFNLLIGHHGVFSLTPIFILAMVGIGLGVRGGDERLRPLHQLAAGLTVAMFVVYTATTDNYGGRCQGARWMFWLAPFWLLAGPLEARRYGQRRSVRVVAVAFLLVSVFSMSYATHQPWKDPWLHEITRAAGWVDY